MDNEKIVLLARLKVKKETVKDFTKTVLSLVELSRAEPGCLNYDVHQAIDDDAVFIWHETWKNKAALDEHFAMPYFAEFFARVGEVAEEPPQITLTKMLSAKI